MEHYYIGSLTKTGFKSRARRIFMDVLYKINFEFKFSHYSEILEMIYEICSPLLSVQQLRKSGQNFMLPAPITRKRAESVVARWVIQSASQRSDAYHFDAKLYNEIRDILHGKGLTIARKNEFHRKVVANRFFMKNYFSKSRFGSSAFSKPYRRVFRSFRKF